MKGKAILFKIIFFVFFVGLWSFFRSFPIQTERWYSLGIYPIIAKTQHFLWGWLPFSVGDVGYTLLIGFVMYFLIKNRKKWITHPLRMVRTSLSFLFLMVFLFFSLWGFNYFRLPLAEKLRIETTYTEENLYKTTDFFVEQANELHRKLSDNDSVKVTFALPKHEIYEIASKSYSEKITQLTDFAITNYSCKSSLYSTALTYMGYSGYLNPFTNEAQVNGKMVGYSVPVTACHEIAHQMGYAAENEANFIGFVTAFRSENLYFKYSASLFALHYLLNDIRKIDREQYQKYIGKLNKGILKNYTETQRFWLTYENKAEPIFKATYDSFLKANNQKKELRATIS